MGLPYRKQRKGRSGLMMDPQARMAEVWMELNAFTASVVRRQALGLAFR